MNDASDIKVGSKVRSFDFADTGRNGEVYGRDLEGERACYVEGTVVGFDDENFDCRRYEIRVERRVFGGKEDAKVDPREAVVYPPVNGTPTLLGRVTNSVELV
jgi:hypothetical protein